MRQYIDVERETLEDMFLKINNNLTDIYEKLEEQNKVIEKLQEAIKGGSIISRVVATVDNVHSDEPYCTASVTSDEVTNEQTLNLHFSGLAGKPGTNGTTGKRGSIIYVGADTTSAEVSGRLKQMTGSDEFQIGDVFIKTLTYEIMQCSRAGKPNEARFIQIGVLGDVDPDYHPDYQFPSFSGNADQLVLANGTVVEIKELFKDNASVVKDNLGYFTGAKTEVTMGNGSFLPQSEFILTNVETIRNALGMGAE